MYLARCLPYSATPYNALLVLLSPIVQILVQCTHTFLQIRPPRRLLGKVGMPVRSYEGSSSRSPSGSFDGVLLLLSFYHSYHCSISSERLGAVLEVSDSNEAVRAARKSKEASVILPRPLGESVWLQTRTLGRSARPMAKR